MYTKWRRTVYDCKYLTESLDDEEFSHVVLDESFILHGRYRVFKTIQVEDGVFSAYDFGAGRPKKDTLLSCANPREVVAKVWRAPSFTECQVERKIYETLYKQQFYQDPRARFGLPEVLANSTTRTAYAIVLEKLGPTLKDLRNRLPDQRFTEQMVLAVAIELLDKYSNLHSLGIIHNGAKPANICLSPKSTRTKSLYVIDFGYSVAIDLERDRIPQDGQDIAGNPMFMSILGNHLFSLSQRDDLESLAYLLVYLSDGSLPWQHETTSSSMTLEKMAVPAKQLFSDMDNSFLEFWKDVRLLAYAEVPDYAGMRGRFEDCWKRKGYEGTPGEFDWWSVMEDQKEAV